MSTEIYKRHRPKTLKGVVGQEGPIASIQQLIDSKKIPHAILFTGPSGCGKTTIARILATVLECGPQDLCEINSADFKGIDMVRDIRRSINFNPISGPTRVWIIDEAHKLTNDAQNAFLKILEDTPKTTYFMLCTTDPQKIIKMIHTRCSEIKLSSIKEGPLKKLLLRVINREEMEVSESVLDEIIEAADGSARKALVILEQVGHLKGEDAQLQAIQATTINKDLAFLLAQTLCLNPRIRWQEVSTILKKIDKDDPEAVRYVVLGYARKILLGGGQLAPRAFMIIDIFSRNFYDSKAAGLAAACWEVCHPAK